MSWYSFSLGVGVGAVTMLLGMRAISWLIEKENSDMRW